MPRHLKPKALTLAGALSLIGLAGCDTVNEIRFKDRPFIMACYSENVQPQSEERAGIFQQRVFDDILNVYGGVPHAMPLHASSIALPAKEKLMAAKTNTASYPGGYGGEETHESFFSPLGFTPEEGMMEEENVAHFAVTPTGDPLINNTNKAYRTMISSQGDKEYFVDPEGAGLAAHYYMDESGSIYPVQFHLASIDFEFAYRPVRLIRKSSVAAILPPDAKYAIYYLEMSLGNKKGESGFWAVPLTHEFRYQPEDFGKARLEDRSLGAYISETPATRDRGVRKNPYQDNVAEMQIPDLRRNSNVKMAPCFANVGQSVAFNEYYRPVTGRDHAAAREHSGRFGNGDMIFLGTEVEDAEALAKSL